jgi:HK97 family phage major capsid protein
MTIEQLRAALQAAREKLHQLKSTLDEARAKLSEAKKRIDEATEDSDLDALKSDFDQAADAYDQAGQTFDEQAEEVERCKRNLADAERRQRLIDDNPLPEPARVRGGKHESVYRIDRPELSFFQDAYAYQFAFDPSARERLEAHGNEMRELGVVPQQRDVGTGAFAGLTVPQYLIELYAPLARAGAPLLSAVRKLPLPDRGMTVNVSRITTGAAAAAQASENSAVQETDIDDTLLTVNVRTYAGQQDVSRQSLERSELVDVVVFQDLIADYFTKLDDAIMNADGTSGTHLGIRSTSGIIAVTYTDASPTVPELYPKLADAIQQMASTRYAPATTVIAHPRRWGWGTAALDSSNRPLFVPNANGPFNALAVGDAPDYGAVVGQIQGLPVITDANVPTNLGGGTEDVILVLRVPDLLFWQEGDGSPRQFRFEQANAPQSIRLAIWGYSAFTAGRYPKASATIGGTGLAAPTF